MTGILFMFALGLAWGAYRAWRPRRPRKRWTEVTTTTTTRSSGCPPARPRARARDCKGRSRWS